MTAEYLRAVAAQYLALAGGRLQPNAPIDLELVYLLARDRLDTIEFVLAHPGEFPTLEPLYGAAQANAVGFGSV